MPLRNRGHNLLEVVIAVTIFSVCAILFVGVWGQYYNSQTLSRNRLAATSLARAVIEQKVATGFAGSVTDPTVTKISSVSEVRGKAVECELTYRFYAEPIVIPAIHPTDPSYRKLRVEVVWEDHVGGLKVIEYETQLYRTN